MHRPRGNNAERAQIPDGWAHGEHIIEAPGMEGYACTDHDHEGTMQRARRCHMGGRAVGTSLRRKEQKATHAPTTREHGKEHAEDRWEGGRWSHR